MEIARVNKKNGCMVGWVWDWFPVRSDRFETRNRLMEGGPYAFPDEHPTIIYIMICDQTWSTWFLHEHPPCYCTILAGDTCMRSYGWKKLSSDAPLKWHWNVALDLWGTMSAGIDRSLNQRIKLMSRPSRKLVMGGKLGARETDYERSALELSSIWHQPPPVALLF